MERAAPLLERILPAKGKHDRGFASPIWAEEEASESVLPLISVVIPAHNEAGYLGATLRGLQRQTWSRREVIVVANGCTDATPEIARSRCDRLIVLSEKSLGIARNVGARMAAGAILLFLDADTILEPGALERVATEFDRSCAAGTLKGRPDRPHWSYHAFYAFKNLLHRCRLHPGSSGVIVCWRDHFLDVGGFDEHLEVRENSHLMRRLQRFGTYKYLGQACATTSMRRFEQRGLGQTFCLWCRVWWDTHFGDLHKRRYESVR